MELTTFDFEFRAENPEPLPVPWTHFGVVGSGDLEILMERRELGGAVRVRVVTPASEFEKVWGLVLANFVREHRLGDTLIAINDNNATPLVVRTRLRQAMAEAALEGSEG